MAVDFQSELSRIATYAYGSRLVEGTRGGMGNIGLVNGHVVKFNTHLSERGGPETEAMRQSCNSLRQKLCSLASSLLGDVKRSDPDFQKEMSSIRKKLGIREDGTTVVAKGLLDRKVVASVIRQIDARTGANSFHDALSNRCSSKGVGTRFADATADIYVKQFMDTNGKTIDNLVKGVADKLTPAGNPGLSAANKTIIRSVLEHSVKDLYVKNGKVTLENLTGDMSNLGIIKTLADEGKFSMQVLTLALSLPPKDINAFLNAYRLVPDRTYATHRRFASVAAELSKLDPLEFTPKNILRLAWPDLKFPDSVINKTDRPLNSDDQRAFFKPLVGPLEDASKYVQSHFDDKDSKLRCNMQVALAQGNGILPKDIQAWLKKPSLFSLSMLPKSAFLAGDDNLEKTPEKTMDDLISDISRDKHDVSILKPDGKIKYKMPVALHTTDMGGQTDPLGNEKTYRDGFMEQIVDLCGKENAAQQRLILLFLSQNTQDPETLMNVSHGVSTDPPTKTRYIMKADPATGDVFVSKTTDPELQWGLSVTVRFGKDGSQTIVDLQERKGRGELVPKDGEGKSMQPKVNMNHEQLV